MAGRPLATDAPREVTLRFRARADEAELIRLACRGEGGVSEVVRTAAIVEACMLLKIDPDEWHYADAAERAAMLKKAKRR